MKKILMIAAVALLAGNVYAAKRHVIYMENKDVVTKWENDGDIHIFDFEFGKLKVSKGSNLFKVSSIQDGIWIKNYSGELPKGIDARYFHIIGDGFLMFAKMRPSLPDKPEAGTDEDAIAKANVIYDAGNFEEALKRYVQVSSKWPNSRLAPYALFMSGQCLTALQKLNEAVTTFSLIAKKYPNSESAKYAMYRIGCLKAGLFNDPDTGVKIFEQYVNKFPGNRLVPDCLFNIAALHLINGKVAEANRIFKILIDKYPNTVRGKSALGNLKGLSDTAAK